MNFIARKIMSTHNERFAGNECYLDEKRERLEKTDKFTALSSAVELDGEGMSLLAKELNVNAQELAFVAKFCAHNL